MKFTDINCPFEKRRQIIVSSEKELRHLLTTAILKDIAKLLYGLPLPHIWERAWDIYKDKYIPCPVFNINEARSVFTFEPGHPIVNNVYAICDTLPDTYVTIRSFHNYFRQLKYKDFTDLCANLGAKEVYLSYAECAGRTINISIEGDVPVELGNLGIGAAAKTEKKINENGILQYSFPQKNQSIKEFSSPWIKTEPTWESMINKRKNNSLEACKVEYSYTDDYGVNMSLFANLNKIGIKLKGKFEEFKEIKLGFNVTFWEN